MKIKMTIKILGSGCNSCVKLENNARKAIKELRIQATVEKITDFKDIVAYGIMTTPALVVDEQVRISGRVPSTKEIKKLLQSF